MEYLANNATCYAMQVHSSPVGSGTGNSQFDLHIFDNVIHGDGCAGINLATIDPSKGTVEVYNNTIYHTGLGNTDGGYGACIFAPGYTNNGTAGSGTVEIYNNTMYDCGPSGSFGQAGIIALSNDTGLTYHLRNNIFYSASSKEAYLLQDNGGTSLFSCSAGDNDFFGNGGVPSGCGSGNLSVESQADERFHRRLSSAIRKPHDCRRPGDQRPHHRSGWLAASGHAQRRRL